MRLGPLLSWFTCLLIAPATVEAAAPSKRATSGKTGKAADTAQTADEAPATVAAEPEPEPEGPATAAATRNPAAAMKGRVGVAGIRTVSGLNGLMVRGYLTDRLTLGAVAGFATFSHRQTNDDGEFKDVNTVGLIGGGPQLFYWPYQGSRRHQVHADFGVGGRALVYVGLTGINRDRPEDATTLDIPVEIDVEIPLAAPLWIGQRVAITPEFGFVARIIPGSREADQNGQADSNPGTGAAQRLGAQNGPGVGFELGNTSAGMFIGLSIGYFFGQLAE